MKGCSKIFLLPLAVLIAGLVLFFVAPSGLLYLFAALFVSLSIMLLVDVRRGIVKGELPGRFGGAMSRQGSPVGFWFQILVYLAMAGFLFFSGLALIGFAPRWFLALLKSMHGHR